MVADDSWYKTAQFHTVSDHLERSFHRSDVFNASKSQHRRFQRAIVIDTFFTRSGSFSLGMAAAGPHQVDFKTPLGQHEDCLRKVFAWLPIKDLVRMNSISHVWQRAATGALHDRCDRLMLDVSGDKNEIRLRDDVECGGKTSGVVVKDLTLMNDSLLMDVATIRLEKLNEFHNKEVLRAVEHVLMFMWRMEKPKANEDRKKLRLIADLQSLRVVDQVFFRPEAFLWDRVDHFDLLMGNDVASEQVGVADVPWMEPLLNDLVHLSCHAQFVNGIHKRQLANLSLKSLKLRMISRPEGEMASLADNCHFIPILFPNLESLEMDFHQFREVAELRDFGHGVNMPQLKRLKLFHQECRMSDATERQMVQANPQEHQVLGDQLDRYDSAEFPQVEQLELHLRPNLRLNKTNLSQIFNFLAKFPNLKELKYHSKPRQRFLNTADKGNFGEMSALYEAACRGKLSRLESLEIDMGSFHQTSKFTALCVRVVTELFALKHLVVKKLPEHKGFAMEQVIKMANECEKLETVSIPIQTGRKSQISSDPVNVISEVFKTAKSHGNLRHVTLMRRISMASAPEKKHPKQTDLNTKELKKVMKPLGGRLQFKCYNGGKYQWEKFRYLGKRAANDDRFWLSFKQKRCEEEKPIKNNNRAQPRAGVEMDVD